MPPKVKVLGISESPLGAFVAADTKYAYDWTWMAQPVKWSDVDADPKLHKGVFEPEPDPDVVSCYVGTQRYKMRYWWHTYLYTTWLPTFRATWNPVQFSYRTAGVVRGAHPYALIADDIKKDGKQRCYEWNLPLGGGSAQGLFRKVAVAPQAGLSAHDIVLGGIVSADPKAKVTEHLDVTPGAPRLLVRVLPTEINAQISVNVQEVQEAPDAKGKAFTFKKVVVRCESDQARFRILLIPFRSGEPLPATVLSENGASVIWADQRDDWHFVVGADDRTRCRLTRNGEACIPVEK
jgi:hypothetical protein